MPDLHDFGVDGHAKVKVVMEMDGFDGQVIVVVFHQ